MILNNLKLVTAVVALGVAGAGAWVYGPAAAQPPGERPAPPRAAAPEADDKPGECRTANFVVRAPTGEVARRAAEAAERERKAQAVRWLGAEMPPWPKPCPLTVATDPKYRGGATNISFDFRGGYEVLDVWLGGDLEVILASILPRETTRIVLAHHFRRPIPPWAYVGAGDLAAYEAEQSQRDQNMRSMLVRKTVLPLSRLFGLKEYTKADASALHGQGYSVTRFLIDRKDRSTFLRFVKRGIADGWDAAAKACYDFDSVEALEAAWLADLRATRAEQPPAGPKTNQGELRSIPLTALRREPPKDYHLDAGDLLGVFVEGVLGEKGQQPPVAVAGPSGAAAVGYPVPVLDDGTILLPRVGQMQVRGKTVVEVHTSIAAECLKAGIVPKGARILVALAKPRPVRVTVVRGDVAGASGRPAVTAVDLTPGDSDVLNALARSGGLPRPDSAGAVVIRRGRGAAARTVHIPMQARDGDPPPFRPQDVILLDGDVLFIDARDEPRPSPAAPSIRVPPLSDQSPADARQAFSFWLGFFR